MRLAAFLAAKVEMLRLSAPWAVIAPTDDEIHRVSDAALEAALATQEEEGKQK